MLQLKSIPYIPVKIPRFKILKRLGYHSRKIELPDEMMAEIDGYIDEAASLINLKAVCLRSEIDLEDSNGTIRIKETGTIFKSTKLKNFLSESDQILLMGLTGGFGVADEIKKLQLEKKMTAAVVIDAAASEIVDEGFTWIAALYSKEMVREGRSLSSRRFSAGYGDFDIRFQQDIYKMLEFEKLDVEITESSMLIPEKSVTAIYGILPAVE